MVEVVVFVNHNHDIAAGHTQQYSIFLMQRYGNYAFTCFLIFVTIQVCDNLFFHFIFICRIYNTVTVAAFQIQMNGVGQSLYSPANGGNAYMMVPDLDIVNSAIALIEKMQTGVVITQEDIDAHMAVYNGN